MKMIESRTLTAGLLKAPNRWLYHHDSPGIHIWFIPISGEKLLSPILVERFNHDAAHEPRKLFD